MAGTASTNYSVPKADFTNAGTNGSAVNVNIFSVEVAALSLSTQPSVIQDLGAVVLLAWPTALPTAADLTAIDGAVAAHVGGLLVGGSQRVLSEAESTNDTTTNQQKAVLNSGLLEGGSYTLSWYCEVATTSILVNSGVKAVLEVDLGSGFVERGEISHDLSTFMPFSGSLPQNRVDGQKIDARIQWRRLGILSNAARIQRCRIAVTRE